MNLYNQLIANKDNRKILDQFARAGFKNRENQITTWLFLNLDGSLQIGTSCPFGQTAAGYPNALISVDPQSYLIATIGENDQIEEKSLTPDDYVRNLVGVHTDSRL